MNRLEQAAEDLAGTLSARRVRVVFAESCTAGLVSASLVAAVGISTHLCGSAVTYRERTKQDWLGVSAADLEQYTAVSEPVARQMALGVLDQTAEADYAAAVTGHLGPEAPAEQDGLVFVAVARRREGNLEVCGVERLTLSARSRADRQREAAAEVLERLRGRIETDFA